MGVPAGAPQAVHDHYAKLPNTGEIWLLFKTRFLRRVVKVKCEGWGQLCDDQAAAFQAFYHIYNKRPHWQDEYVGWEEIGGTRRGAAPADFAAQYRRQFGIK